MPIKPFALEDLTATLQVPIPGIPGAYGELELSGEGTATIALGAEVPVPFLDDMVNGEIQLEIDKEGEIAYGVEVNLAGLALEVMVRGCNIVVDLGYGALETQAVFPIPDCEEDEEPSPRREQIEHDEDEAPPNLGEESWELPPIPPVDSAKTYHFLMFTDYFSPSGHWDNKIQTNFTASLVQYNPSTGTALFSTNAEAYSMKGFVMGASVDIIAWTYYFINGTLTAFSHPDTWNHRVRNFLWDIQSRSFRGWEIFVGVVRGSELLLLLQKYPKLFSNYTQVLRYWTYQQTVVIKLTEINSPTPRAPVTGIGEPPMKDCCAEIKKQLKKLRKELKDLTDTVSPPDFVETIFPPEYDDKGKLVLRNAKEKVTLAEVLEELLKKSDTQIPTSYLTIPDPWKPKSWSDKLDSKTASIIEMPEEKTVPISFAFKAVYHALYKLLYVIDPDDMKFSRIPARFVKPGANPNENEDFGNYPEALALLYQMIDNYGFHPFRVQIDDTDLSIPGQQSSVKEYLSQGAAMRDILEQLGDMNAESNVQVELLVRLAYEIGLCHNVGADSQQKLQNIQDYLGFEIRKGKKDLKMAFNPLAGESAIHAAEKGEEALEDQLPGLLENTTMPLVVDEFSGSKTLQDFLMEILNAARQKPKGNRWG